MFFCMTRGTACFLHDTWNSFTFFRTVLHVMCMWFNPKVPPCFFPVRLPYVGSSWNAPPPAWHQSLQPAKSLSYRSSSCCGRGKCKEGQRRCTGAPGRAERVDRPARPGAARSRCRVVADAARCSVPVAAAVRRSPTFPAVQVCDGLEGVDAAHLQARAPGGEDSSFPEPKKGE